MEKLTKSETKESSKIAAAMAMGATDYAARSADVWLRSSPNHKSQARRAAFLAGIGLSASALYI